MFLLSYVKFVEFFKREPDNDQMESEFVTGGSVPSLGSEAEIDLSVIIPAYNEIDRLPGMLDECVECLKTAKKQTWVRVKLRFMRHASAFAIKVKV